MTPGRDPGGGTMGRCGAPRHIPVLLAEVLAALSPRAGATYIDGTFGAGGYTRALLEAADCRVMALDRDPEAVRAGAEFAGRFAPRLALHQRPFGELAQLVHALGLEAVDGVVLDLGVSSMQLDTPERGFSFQHEGPLDMRMTRSGATAADVVNEAAEADLADILYLYGEERRSRAIARALVRARAQRPFTTTRELASAVARVLGGRKIEGRHPATRTFQALRIHVNDELGELARGLAGAEEVLAPGGRLVVVTFHSLEDRIVKRFLAARSGKESRGSRHLPERAIASPAPSFRIVNPRPLTPSKAELEANPRARSARLRAAERTSAPSWPPDSSLLDLPRPATEG
jgi:16S rRNA (cytosine1402-N4)-methyltransferase